MLFYEGIQKLYVENIVDYDLHILLLHTNFVHTLEKSAQTSEYLAGYK